MSPLYRRRNLFNVKRLMLLGLMALVLSASLALTTGVASAHTASPRLATTSGFGYDGQDPYTTGCASGAVFKSAKSSPVSSLPEWTETAELVWSPTCQTAWGWVVLNKPLPVGSKYRANAIITRNNDARQYDCTTGDQIVYPTQTECYSGMVYDPDGYSAYTAGMFLVIPGTWTDLVHTDSY